MRVELWMASDLARLPGVSLPEYQHRLAFFYNDTTSKDAKFAAERAWRITNAAINRLEGEDLKLRQDFQSVAPGQALSFGDIVKVDGSSLMCEKNGFSVYVSGETKRPIPAKRIGLDAIKP